MMRAGSNQYSRTVVVNGGSSDLRTSGRLAPAPTCGSAAMQLEQILVRSSKRTLQPTPSQIGQSCRNQHRKASPTRLARRGAPAMSQFLSLLWFLVIICDNQTVLRVTSRTRWWASAATIGPSLQAPATPHWAEERGNPTDGLLLPWYVPPGDAASFSRPPETETEHRTEHTDSIISSGGGGGDGDDDDSATSSGHRVNHTKLQEIVMEGLGLSSIPDVRLMNVSQQEYETKYAEYLNRVNRRHARPEGGGGGLDEDDGWFEQRRLFSFPGTDHTLNHRKLRRKRSLNNDYDLVYIRFDIPTRNASTGEMTGFQSPSLYHDPREADEDVIDAAADAADAAASSVADHPGNVADSFSHPLHHRGGRGRAHRQSLSELPPISPENIEESSLNIMLTRRQNSARSTNAHSKHQHHAPQHQAQREQQREQQQQERPREQRHQVQQPTQQTPAQQHQQQLLQAHAHRRKGRVRFKQAPAGQQHHAGRSTVTVHVYQLMEPYERHYLTSRTIALQEIVPNGSRWYQLPLEEAVRTWLDGSRKNLGLELYCEGCHAHGIYIVHDASPYFRSYDETPVLNVVGRLVQREKRSKVQRYRPTMYDYLSPPKTTACTAGNKRCCRHPLLVDFRDIEGFNFIIQPKIFDAGFCKGRCPTKHIPATYHALLQSLLHEHIKYDVPKPCCAPASLDHIDILHADPMNPERLKVSTWHNMRVLECACS